MSSKPRVQVNWSLVAVVAVFAGYELVDQRQELHLLRANYLIDYFGVFSVAHVDEVLVRCYEWLLAQLRLQVNSKGLDSVAH